MKIHIDSRECTRVVRILPNEDSGQYLRIAYHNTDRPECRFYFKGYLNGGWILQQEKTEKTVKIEEHR